MRTPVCICPPLNYLIKNGNLICVYLYIQYTLANPDTVNPDRNMKNEKFCSQLSTYFKRHVGFRSKRFSDCVEGSWRD
jgi:hypothetical protein